MTTSDPFQGIVPKQADDGLLICATRSFSGSPRDLLLSQDEMRAVAVQLLAHIAWQQEEIERWRTATDKERRRCTVIVMGYLPFSRERDQLRCIIEEIEDGTC